MTTVQEVLKKIFLIVSLRFRLLMFVVTILLKQGEFLRIFSWIVYNRFIFGRVVSNSGETVFIQRLEGMVSVRLSQARLGSLLAGSAKQALGKAVGRSMVF